MNQPDDSQSSRVSSTLRRRRIAVDLSLLVLLVCAGYFVRLSSLPLVGEESRRARGAINMMETGDWVVVRQGGLVFPDRPPMSNWLIAATALILPGEGGEVDRLAIRLPSAVAVLLTTLLIYGYCRGVGSSRLVGVTAASAYATFGQVLQLGRTGESEAVFTLFMGGSLLVWHLGFRRGWSPALTWSLGYGLTALGALTKGLQAPVYFLAATGAFLLWNRRWRWIFGWGQWVGLACFLAILGAWQIPYYLATDLQSVKDTWFSVVGPRLGLGGQVEHLATYPLETLGTLLPWSLVLFLLAGKTVRSALRENPGPLAFVLTALVVTYPSVWLSAGAKGRYYLPLFPCFAVLIGLVVESWVLAPPDSRIGRLRRIAWRGLTGAAIGGGLLVLLSWVVPQPWAVNLRPSLLWTAFLLLLVVSAVRLMLRAHSRPGVETARVALFSMALLLAVLYNGVWGNALAHRWVDLGPQVQALRSRIPNPAELVSLSPVDSRFAYHHGDLIQEIPWPRSLQETPPDLDYFCFDWRSTDTVESRRVWRGMKTWTTPGALPFLWQEVGRVGVDRRDRTPPRVAVVVGRVIRDVDGSLIPRRTAVALRAPVESGTGESGVEGSAAAAPD